MRMTLLAAVSTALLISVPATAQISQTGTAAQSTKVTDSDQASGGKKVCKRLPTSGTRLAERVCLTKEEWKKVEEEK
jgi:hypothetical protein